MPTQFEKDNEEYSLIDTHPSSTQRKYGRPNYKEDIRTKYRSIDLKMHLNRIHNITGTKDKHPKIGSVDKSKITHTGVI